MGYAALGSVGALGILGRLGWNRMLCLDAAVVLRGRSVGSADFL